MKKVLLTFLMFLLTMGPGYTAAEREQQEGITITLAGDMMFDKYVGMRIKQYGGSSIFEDYAGYLKNSDIVIGNLETALSDRGTPVEGKEYTFRSRPEVARLLKEHNFTAVSIANNHILDYGVPAFNDTLKHLKDAGIHYGGGGYNRAEAEAGIVIEKNNTKVGFIAFSGVIPSVDWYAGKNRPGILGAYKVHEAAVTQSIKKLKERCDLVVVSVHWGKEGAVDVRKQETEMAHKMVDAGADIVMGHHPHVVQGVELYNGKPIFYSLGNFIFTQSRSEICNKMLIASIRYDRDKNVAGIDVVPGIINGGKPVVMDEKQKSQFITDLNKQSINIRF